KSLVNYSVDDNLVANRAGGELADDGTYVPTEAPYCPCPASPAGRMRPARERYADTAAPRGGGGDPRAAADHASAGTCRSNQRVPGRRSSPAGDGHRSGAAVHRGRHGRGGTTPLPVGRCGVPGAA